MIPFDHENEKKTPGNMNTKSEEQVQREKERMKKGKKGQ